MYIRQRPLCSARRPGGLSILLLLLLILLLALLALAVNPLRLWTVRVELQNSADAAALAAAQSLVSDDLLRAKLDEAPTTLPALLQQARLTARQVAKLNPVNGQPFVLQDNPSNLASGDIVFGTVATPLSKAFQLAEDVNDTSNKHLLTINTVLIHAWLTAQRGTAPSLFFPPFTGTGYRNVRTRAAATLDTDVIGFRHVVQQPIPLAPVGLLSDYSGADSRSWQQQVEQKSGTDANADGLHEWQAQLATDNTQLTAANVVLLFIGTNDISELNAQLLAGVTQADLQNFGQPFVLNASNELDVDGQDLLSPGAGLDELHDTLVQLQTAAAVRIWPLYSSFAAASNTATLCGFVAGRVLSVNAVTSGSPLTFSIQPTMLITHAAVTDATHRNINGIPIVNPYICKVRLVE